MSSHERVLIIEDELPMRRALEDCLAVEGYRVITADNGAVGLERALKEQPDLVLLDVMMPKLDGLQVVDELKKTNSPVLAHTYLLTAGTIDQYNDVPVRGVVEKPFDIHALVAETKDCIGH